MTGAYRRSFFADPVTPAVASARAGNVIGGGDWGEDRLLADAVRAVEADAPLRVRNPSAVRPWQHVFGALSGYLLLAQTLWEGSCPAGAWNFGPPREEARSVEWVVEELARLWEGALRWEPDRRAAPPEASYLAIDSSGLRTGARLDPAADARASRWSCSWPGTGPPPRVPTCAPLSLAQLDQLTAATSAPRRRLRAA